MRPTTSTSDFCREEKQELDEARRVSHVTIKTEENSSPDQNEELTNLRNELYHVVQRSSQFEDQCSALQETVKERDQEICLLRRELGQKNFLLSQIQTITTSAEKKNEALREREVEISQLKNVVRNLESDLSRVINKLQDQENSINVLKDRIKEKEQEVAMWTKQNEKVVQLLKNKWEELNSTKAELSNEKNLAQNKIKELQLQLDEKNDENSRREAECLNHMTEMRAKKKAILDQYMTCSICNEVFVFPWTIGCGHTFCRSCIAEKFQQSSCPTCGAMIASMHHDSKLQDLIEEFSADFYPRSLLDARKVQSVNDHHVSSPHSSAEEDHRTETTFEESSDDEGSLVYDEPMEEGRNSGEHYRNFGEMSPAFSD